MTRPVLTAGLVLTLVAGPAAAQQYPTTPPPAGPLTQAPFPPILEATLPTGVRVLVVENHQQPVVSVGLSFPAGSVFDPPGKEGLADMVAGLLTKGAGARTADQIAEMIEGTGGALSAAAGADFMSVDVSVLAPSLELAFELLGDVIARATFPAEELELLRTQTLSGLQVELSNPASIASRAFQRAIWGGHPYARATTPVSARAITREDLLSFQRERVRPAGALLVVAGDVTLDRVRTLATRAFEGWTGAPAPAAARRLPRQAASELILVHRPGSVQSNILIGQPTYPPTDPRHYAATVANRVLGGGAASRLFMILREQKSWTYGAYSSLVRRLDQGYFVASAEVRTEVTDSALTELLVQLRRLRDEPVPADELEAAKGALVGSYPLSIETAAEVAGAVSSARLYGLPDDYVQTYRLRLGAVTAEDVQAAARVAIRPDSGAIVVVGDGAKIYDALKDIARTRVVDVEGEPLSAEALTTVAAPLPFDVGKLAPGRDSFAIVVQGNTLGYQTSRTERTETGFQYFEATRVAGFVAQNTIVTTDSGFHALRVNQSGAVQGQETSVEVTFADGRARGSATTPGPDGMQTVTIDTVVVPGALEENLIQPVLPALAWAPDARWTFSVFGAGSGEARAISLAVTGTEEVATPAGAAECYRVELSGGQQPATFWVTIAAPHRLMKIALAGTPLEILRASP